MRLKTGEKMKAAAIGDVVKNVFSEIEEKSNVSQEAIEALWKSAVGEAGFGHSRPFTLKKKILSVRVDSSGWLQKLTMEKREILKGLKKTLGKDRISEIHFKIGEF